MKVINRYLNYKQYNFQTLMCHQSGLCLVLWALFWNNLRLICTELKAEHHYLSRSKSIGVCHVNAAEQLHKVWLSVFCKKKNVIVMLLVHSVLPLKDNLSCSKGVFWKCTCIWIYPRIANGLGSSEACGERYISRDPYSIQTIRNDMR